MFISIFKNVYARYNNLNFELRLYSNRSESEKNRYRESRVYSNLWKCGFNILTNRKICRDVNKANKNKITYYAEIWSNGIYILDICNEIYELDENVLFNYIDKYIDNNNKHTFSVGLKWDIMKSKFLITDASHKFDIKNYKKIHPNVYFDHIYILNLKKDTEKRQHMDGVFNDLMIKHDFFDAVNGRTDDNLAIYKKNSYEKTLKSPGAYGYSLSMIKLFEDALSKGYKKILVCDDDIIFHREFLELFNKNVRDIPFDWKVLFFGLSGPWTHPFVNESFKHFDYSKSYIDDVFNCDGSYCVGYDTQILKNLIDVTKRFEAQFDTSMIRYLNQNKSIIKFSFCPYLVIADTTTSSISEREQDTMENFTSYQFKFRQNLNTFDIDSMKKMPYNKFYKNPYPLVSIIVTVFNKIAYLRDSIDSILQQTYKNIELIIIEDMSTDGCRAMLKYYDNIHNVKIIYNQENIGCYKSRNVGIKCASGEVIGFHDADDYALSNKIEKQIKFMNENNLLMVGCNMIRSHLPNINFKSDEGILGAAEKVNKIFNNHHNECCKEFFGYVTLLFKKNLFEKYGTYIEGRKGMDMEFPERVMFKELGIIMDDSWEFFDKSCNDIYKKINDLLVISPEMNHLNITNSIASDKFLTNREWRMEYKS